GSVGSARTIRPTRKSRRPVPPRAALSGCPTKIQAAKTATKNAKAPRRWSVARASNSTAKKAHGQRHKTPEKVIRSQGGIDSEKAKAIAPRREAVVEISIARNQSHIPVIARSSFRAAARVSAWASGRISVPNVKGENAPNCHRQRASFRNRSSDCEKAAIAP